MQMSVSLKGTSLKATVAPRATVVRPPFSPWSLAFRADVFDSLASAAHGS